MPTASTRSNLLLNHTPGLGFHMMEQKIGSATVTLPMGKVRPKWLWCSMDARLTARALLSSSS